MPKDIDENIADLKLKSMGIKIDTLTEEQKKRIAQRNAEADAQDSRDR